MPVPRTAELHSQSQAIAEATIVKEKSSPPPQPADGEKQIAGEEGEDVRAQEDRRRQQFEDSHRLGNK